MVCIKTLYKIIIILNLCFKKAEYCFFFVLFKAIKYAASHNFVILKLIKSFM